ncbi:MAG: hypothetical protein ABSG88_24625 [Bradyrhizobium sp.]
MSLSILMETLAALQSIASTAATHRTRKAGDEPPCVVDFTDFASTLIIKRSATMHGSEMSPQTFWLILKSATDDEVSPTHQHNVRDGRRRIRVEPNKSTKRSFAFSRLRPGTFTGCGQGEIRSGISGRLAGSNHREPNQLRAHRSSRD